MICIISGTNRPGSATKRVAQSYRTILNEKKIENKLLDLQDFSSDMFYSDMYAERKGKILSIQKEYLMPAEKFLFVVPEYNGSFPGIVKLLIDASQIGECWAGKKAAITGVAAGRAGNLRGIDHLTNILNHIKINVLFNKLPISGSGALLDDKGVKDSGTLELMEKVVDSFVEF